MLLAGATLIFAACGGDDDDDDGSDGSGATATATVDDSDDDADDDGDDSSVDEGDDDSDNEGDDDGDDGGNGGGADTDDMEQVADALEPPNSSETARFASADGLLVSYESTDSLDDLKGYYEDKLDDLGINVLGTMSAADSQTWVIGDEDGSGVQGGVTLAPSGTGTTLVQITLGIQSS
jgi:hypothetical protein